MKATENQLKEYFKHKIIPRLDSKMNDEESLSIKNNFLFYTAQGGEVKLQDFLYNKTPWLTQKLIAKLFNTSTDNVSLRLKNIYKDKELQEKATAEYFSVVQKENSRDIRRNLKFYNLDAIIAVGCHINSKRATQFRIWATQGENIDSGSERYGLTWPGKSDCFKFIQETSVGTLKPCKEESLNFDSTENIFIKGDNLEILKILQKAYYSKVKMIYIAPPYNTGKEFICLDKFQENLDTYLKYTGQKDDEELRFSTNQETDGKFHSKWLNMMYPRLFLARNLLRDDGVIFISIDDNEIHNLRKICDEIFGMENFLCLIVWKKKTNGNNMGFMPPVYNYFICYSKHFSEKTLIGFPISDKYIKKKYSNPDNNPRGDWTRSDLSASHECPYFEIINPITKKIHFPLDGRYWVLNEAEVKKRIKDNRIIFGKRSIGKPVQKKFFLMRVTAESCWDKHGMDEGGTKELALLFKPKIFTHTKPSITIKHICNISTTNKDIILDFFSGYSTTVHAVMQLNAEENSNRKYIMVQLPEPCDEDSEAFKENYKTISDIGKERIRRVAKKIKEENSDYEADLEFRVFKLDKFNFKVLDNNSNEEIEEQLSMHLDNLISDDSKEENILYEIIIKSGFEPTTKIKEKTLANKKVYSISNDSLLVCLDRNITKKVILEIAKLKPPRSICLDEGFYNNDQLKTNAVETMRSHGVETFRTI